MTECIEIIWLMIILMALSTYVGGSHVFDYISLYVLYIVLCMTYMFFHAGLE
jgi:hypothetical protein